MVNSSGGDVYMLAIESSCDDTSAAVIRNDTLLSNVVAGQKVHEIYGGVVPELASRAHQQNIIPVVEVALKRAGVMKNELAAVAFTRGPGLLGSLLVGTSFAKGFALALGIPLIEVNHLQAHVLALFIREPEMAEAGQLLKTESYPSESLPPPPVFRAPSFPFLCLLVSGGNSQIILVKDHLHMEVIGQTIDDAAGEAFDKCAKVMGLPYPGGPYIDRLAREGDPLRFSFAKPRIQGLDYSFSGLKTSFLYFLRDQLKEDPDFIEKNKADLAASLQQTIIDILLQKLVKAAKKTRIGEIAIAGGVSANSGLREAIQREALERNWKVYIPKLEYTMDNAAMIGIAGYYKYLKGDFAGQNVVPYSRTHL